MTQYWDITRTLGRDSLTWPGDFEFHTENRSQAGITVHTLHLSSHSGTHLDAPRHFVGHGKTLDTLDVSRFIVSAQVLEIHSDNDISADSLIQAGMNAAPGDAVLLKTQNRLLPRNEFSDKFIGIDESAAAYLVDKGVGLVGIDYLSIENSPDGSYPVHHILLENNILILEDINLSEVEAGRYELIVLPLKWDGADGAPARAVLRTERPA